VRRAAGVSAAILAGVLVTGPALPASADEIRDGQWHLRALDVVVAHQITRGAGATVAVVDTGVEPHIDLRRNLLPGTVVDPAGEGDGRTDQVGHGTAMAGLIAAHGRGSNLGALGVAPDAKILPIADNVGGGQGTTDLTAAGIEWAIAHDADVINISGGGGPSPRLRAAIQAALDANIVVVAGVGNRPAALGVQFPAMYPGVLAVGATDENGQHADISVTGRGIVLSAPGVNIHSTSLGGRYQVATGTSDATAIVSGAAALVRSRFPDLPASEVVHRLTATATDKGAPGWDEEYGYGVLNLVAALTADVPPSSAPPRLPNATATATATAAATAGCCRSPSPCWSRSARAWRRSRGGAAPAGARASQ
jgi:type VII secretion-associated serine protease mycosin